MATFPRTDVQNMTAATTIISNAQAKGAIIRIADTRVKERWLKILTTALREAGILQSTANALVDLPQGYQLIQVQRRRNNSARKSGNWYIALIGNTKIVLELKDPSYNISWSYVGSPYASGITGFRSPSEFIPHAIWLFLSPDLDHSVCTHLFGQRRVRAQKLPVSSPSNFSSTLCTSDSPPDQVSRSSNAIHAYFRKGDIVWVALNPKIIESSTVNIQVWPALIFEVCTSTMEGMARFKIKPFGPGLQSQTCFVQENRILPFKAYMPPVELIDTLKSTLELHQAPPTSHEPLIVNFEKNDLVFSQNPSFVIAALPYIGALLTVFERAASYEVLKQPSLFFSARPENVNDSALGKISFTSQQNLECSNFMEPLRWGAEYIQIGDLVRLGSARKDLVTSQHFVYPPSGPGEYFSRMFPHSPELTGASSRGLFLKIMAWRFVHYPQPNTLSAGGVLYEVADKDAAVIHGQELEGMPKAYHGYKFCPIMKPGYLAVVPLDDIRGRYYPASQMISTFYGLDRAYIGSATSVQLHLQSLAGLWPDDSEDFEIRKHHHFSEGPGASNSTPDKQQLMSFLNKLSEIIRRRDSNFEKYCPHVMIKMEEFARSV
ncbi:hypothetical protein C8J55DRAFT_566720 [Lentinula edodes]|uniref:Cryptic loci regulator 2 N-terminal domain-containing protein n=1 Tax=Lentinula lateritia TaxID=40482 RepID=A0A9W9DDC9_9AGAR|nr:hypothetical protein C8J55DRAFT_566720 [Lentinula edodes]